MCSYKGGPPDFHPSLLFDLFIPTEPPTDSLTLVPIETTISTIRDSFDSGDESALRTAIQTLSASIVDCHSVDPSLLQSDVLPILCSICQSPTNPDLSILCLHLLTVISVCNSALLPQMATAEFVDFCVSLLSNPDPRVHVSVFDCLHNFAHEGAIFRDLLLVKLPIERVSNGWIRATEWPSSVRSAAMGLVCAYAFYELPWCETEGILDLCAECLSGPCEELFYSSLWAMVFLVDLCPRARKKLVQPPFPDLVDLMLYGRSPADLAPALQLARRLFLAGVELPMGSYFNFLSLIAHADSKISKYAYEGLVDMIQGFPNTVQRLMANGFLSFVRGVMESNACPVKIRAASLLCLIIENHEMAVADDIIAMEMIPEFLQMIQIEWGDLGKRVIIILGRLCERYSSNGALSRELLCCGAREVLEDLIDRRNDLAEIVQHFVDRFLQENQSDHEERNVLSSMPRHRAPRVSRRQTETPRRRMKLWVTRPAPGSN
jgi:hypothetical protein